MAPLRGKRTRALQEIQAHTGRLGLKLGCCSNLWNSDLAACSFGGTQREESSEDPNSASPKGQEKLQWWIFKDFHGARMVRNTMTPKPNMGSETTNRCSSSGQVVWASESQPRTKHLWSASLPKRQYKSADGWKSWSSTELVEFVQCLGFKLSFSGGKPWNFFCQRPHWCETGHLCHQPCLYTSNYGNVHWSSSSQVKTKRILCGCATCLSRNKKD